MELKEIKEKLENYGVVFEHGLTNEEVAFAEQKFSFKFPPDLKAFLQYALPIAVNEINDPNIIRSKMKFPNWRDLESDSLKIQVEAPLDGILFDVENNHFWLDELGPRPANSEDAKRIMTESVNKAPKLVPVYGHRFIPSEPLEEGNPVFSVHQTDIIYYGNNLEKYLNVEFGSPGQMVIYAGDDEEPKKIRFWSKLVDMNS